MLKALVSWDFSIKNHSNKKETKPQNNVQQFTTARFSLDSRWLFPFHLFGDMTDSFEIPLVDSIQKIRISIVLLLIRASIVSIISIISLPIAGDFSFLLCETWTSLYVLWDLFTSKWHSTSWTRVKIISVGSDILLMHVETNRLPAAVGTSNQKEIAPEWRKGSPFGCQWLRRLVGICIIINVGKRHFEWFRFHDRVSANVPIVFLLKLKLELQFADFGWCNAT